MVEILPLLKNFINGDEADDEGENEVELLAPPLLIEAPRNPKSLRENSFRMENSSAAAIFD